jgi:hypothetical protein
MKLIELLTIKFQGNSKPVFVVQTCADGQTWYPEYASIDKGSVLHHMQLNDMHTYKEYDVDCVSKIMVKDNKPPVVISGEAQYGHSGESMEKAKENADKPKRNWVSSTPTAPKAVEPPPMVPVKKMGILRNTPPPEETKPEVTWVNGHAVDKETGLPLKDGKIEEKPKKIIRNTEPSPFDSIMAMLQ